MVSKLEELAKEELEAARVQTLEEFILDVKREQHVAEIRKAQRNRKKSKK